MEYQGWTNSKTWNAAWLLEQDRKTYEKITTIRKAGRQVEADFVKLVFFHNFSLSVFENWTEGEVNWQEIADFYNDQEY